MSKEIEDTKPSHSPLSVVQVVRGAFFMIIGLIFLFHKIIHIKGLGFPAPVIAYSFGTLAFLYGSWRMYRAVTKKA